MGGAQKRGASRGAPGTTLINVSRPDGEVIAEGGHAINVRGRPNGQPCWIRMRSVPGLEGLQCSPGCTGRLVAQGSESRCPVTWRGAPYELNCLPVNGRVVSVLSPGRNVDQSEQEAVSLTEREYDVLRLLAEGLTSANIAAELGIGAGTVRSHVEHLREKLGAATRAAIVGRAFRLGVLH